MPKYQLLLADADGTLLDFAAAEDKALRLACGRMGLAVNEGQAGLYKRINDGLWRDFERGAVTQEELRVLRFARFLEAIGAERDAEAMADAFVEALSQQGDEMDGAVAFLREAAARVPVVIVTNGIARVQRSRFARSALAAYVSGYVISGEAGVAKPDPRMVEKAREVGGPERPALMLGDEPRSDIAAANAAGIDSCWFNPKGRENETRHRPTYEIRRLDEALQWL